MRGVLLQTSTQQPPDGRRRCGRQRVPVRSMVDDPDHDVRRCLSPERRLTREHLEQHAPERPQIRAPVDGYRPHLLGSHVGSGSEDQARDRRSQSPER